MTLAGPRFASPIFSKISPLDKFMTEINGLFITISVSCEALAWLMAHPLPSNFMSFDHISFHFQMNPNLVTTKRITILYAYIMIRYPSLVSRISIVVEDSFSIDIAVTHIIIERLFLCCNHCSWDHHWNYDYFHFYGSLRDSLLHHI